MIVTFNTAAAALLFHDPIENMYYFSTDKSFNDASGILKTIAFSYKFTAATMNQRAIHLFMRSSSLEDLTVGFGHMANEGALGKYSIYFGACAFGFGQHTYSIGNEIKVETYVHKPKVGVIPPVDYDQSMAVAVKIYAVSSIANSHGFLTTITAENITTVDGKQIQFEFDYMDEDLIKLIESNLGKWCKIRLPALTYMSGNLFKECNLCMLVD